MDKKDLLVGMIIGKYYVEKNGKPNYNAIEKNILLAEEYAIKLWNEGFGVITPHLNTRHFEVKTKVPEDVFKKFDSKLMPLAKFVFVLPNWKKSEGTKREIKNATSLKIPIFYDLEKLKKWRESIITEKKS
jgi:hypothetical protein